MIRWTPNGILDVASDPSSLPEVSDGKNIVSTALTRCKNLRLDNEGKAQLRFGSSSVQAAVASQISLITEQGGELYSFAGSSIYRAGTSITAAQTSADWYALKYNAFNDSTLTIFAANGAQRVRITGSSVDNWGIGTPPDALVVAAGALTGLTGVYKAQITYARLVAGVVVTESNPSAASAAVTLTDGSLSITWVASIESQVTHVRVYRTAAGGSTYLYVQDVAIGTLTLDTNKDDLSLGSAVAENHNRPPFGGSLVLGPIYDGICLMALDNLLYYSLSKQPEYWPTTQFLEIGNKQFPITAMLVAAGQAYVFTRERLWFIQGTGVNSLHPIPMSTMTGAVNSRAVAAVDGYGIFHVGADGVYLFAANKDTKITEPLLDPVFRGETTNGIAGVTDIDSSWLHQHENDLWFHYGAGNVLMLSLESGKIEYRVYDEALIAPLTDVAGDRLLTADASNRIRKLDDQAMIQDITTDIAWETESKEFTLPTRAHFPRWVKYDVDHAAATGTLLLDGVAHQTHSITVRREVKRRLVGTGNGNRCSIRLTGTGPTALYSVEME